MILENEFDVPLSPSETWAVLLDVPGIVGCVPGAELISAEPDGTYKGRILVKLGPLTLTFNGTVKIDAVDPESGGALVHAKGADQKGRGNAGATTKMQISPAAAGALVSLETDLQLSGMIAQYGRAQGMIAALSREIIQQFAGALREELTELARSSAEGEEKGPVVLGARPRSQSAHGLSLLWRGLRSRDRAK